MKTVNRRANVGERILITDKMKGETRYENGAKGDVTKSNSAGIFADINSNTCGIFHGEYEVIIEEANEIGVIEKMQAEIADLKSKVAKLEAPNLNCRHIVKPKSPQRIRDEIMVKAKADVVNLLDTVKFTFLFTGRNIQVLPHFEQDQEQYETLDEVKFVVNSEKRTVVSLAYYAERVVLRGIAKADPSDCFNVHIGKAIALRRALGLEVPAEYYNAPAPTEVRVGDVIKYTYSSGNGPYKMLVVPKGSGTQVGVKVGVTSIAALKGKIIDDSREVAE